MTGIVSDISPKEPELKGGTTFTSSAMQPAFTHKIRAFALFASMLLWCSCASYNKQIARYYGLMTSNNYEKAFQSIDHIKKLRTGRNELLYLFEKGKMAHLLGLYDSSNAYFNQADLFMEDARRTAGDVAVGYLLNPMMETYRGEDFEKFMVHYYKALNYLYLGLPEEALVEARRISLQSYSQQDKAGPKNNRYSDDAFSLIIQGIIYEQSGDINNAFIAYRNAADIFIKNDNLYYGVAMPEQLQQDVLRTASLNGFADEVDRYERLFDIRYKKSAPGPGGELILFWENGLAPVKVQQDFFFALNKDAGGNFFFSDPSGAFHIPFDLTNQVDRSTLSAANLRSFHVAFPRYEEQPVFFTGATVLANNQSYALEEAEDINTLAIATLKERFLKDMSATLTRLAIKKLAEAALRPKNDSAKNKEAREAMAMAVQVFSFLSEKADTRNWQSLPHTIYYTRIPLAEGENDITLRLRARTGDTARVHLQAPGTGGLIVRNICTFR